MLFTLMVWHFSSHVLDCFFVWKRKGYKYVHSLRYILHFQECTICTSSVTINYLKILLGVPVLVLTWVEHFQLLVLHFCSLLSSILFERFLELVCSHLLGLDHHLSALLLDFNLTKMIRLIKVIICNHCFILLYWKKI